MSDVVSRVGAGGLGVQLDVADVVRVDVDVDGADLVVAVDVVGGSRGRAVAVVGG